MSHAPTCPYCHRRAELVLGLKLYPHIKSLAARWFWRCDPCDAHCGCHERGAYIRESDGRRVLSDGTLPLGRLANAELRKAKQRAHAAFDPLWKSDAMTRREAYAWLAGELGISPANCHIGMMDVDGCKAIAQVCAAKRQELGAALISGLPNRPQTQQTATGQRRGATR